MATGKKEILEKFINVPEKPSRKFWAREYAMFNKLEERYSIEFFVKLDLGKKFDSFAILLSESFKDELDTLYRRFGFKPKEIYVPRKINVSDEKIGEDIIIDKEPHTVRQFLNE
jgi:hypothetical protein